ncbi:Udp-glycosyltransferase 79b3 [Thalictrum thalictroides]|uniref:Udp-glycosyltransferase 79b3 n=1 Tax=Thalictrum thalictroides TaxID=46969 RepID=A0A7J6VCT8_THATH|nr:Udp-glycosyltransferase 79b3 [Thalictrum thalictroides]
MAATATFHVVMFPWFAMGHITPYLQLANKFAERGHKVSFFIPNNTQNKVNHLNLHPHLITFIPLIVPQVDGLPVGTETMSDLPVTKSPLLLRALDLTEEQVEPLVQKLKPDFIFFDFCYWITTLARRLGIISIYFSVVSPVAEASLFNPRFFDFKPFEAKGRSFLSTEIDGRISFINRLATSGRESEALCYRGCSEMEGPYCEYLKNVYNKQVLVTGPILPEPSHNPLEERWSKWLGGFEKGSVVYCAFGSECVLEKNQFQELVLGLEQTGLPFLVRLKPPVGAETLEEALPEGFQEKVKGRGIVHGGWVQQQQILNHPSVGCFVSHGGSSSIWESLVSSCQIILVPHSGAQFADTKFMSEELKVAVNVERREEDGWFTRESVCEAVKLVMDESSEIGKQVRANHHKWKEFLLSEGLESSYIDNLIIKLQDMLK